MKRPSRKALIVIGIACAIAFAASSYLGWVALTSSKVAGCGGGKLFNCGHVISSRWSLWMGIPISLIAATTYVWMSVNVAVVSMAKAPKWDRTVRWSWFAIFTSALSAGLAAIWFVSLQVFVLNHLCTYCLVAHGCGLVAAATVLMARPLGWKPIRSAGAFAVVGFVALAGVQLVSEDPATYRIETFEAPAKSDAATEFEAPVFEAPIFEAPVSRLDLPIISPKAAIAFVLNSSSLLTGMVQAPTHNPATTQASSTKSIKSDDNPSNAAKPRQAAKARRFVELNGGVIKLDVTQWPIAGSTESKFIFVEMFDYSCPHCRHTHVAIKEASKTLNNDVAVIALPVPLNAACNPAIQVTDPKFNESCDIAKLAVAVWRVDPAVFTEFHHWMMSTEAAPTLTEARAKAESLTDAEKLNAELATEIPQKYIAQTSELYRRVGSGNVPKLIFPATSIVGEFTSGDGLVQVIKQQIK